MKADSLWYDLKLGGKEGNTAQATLTLKVCLNCGKVKVASNPCGFDHLAAVDEFRRDIQRLHALRAGREGEQR